MRIALLVLMLLTAPVAAGETPWQDLAPGVNARLISSDVLSADGTTMVGLELDMPGNTKTYWRIPGETGIAAGFAFTGGVSGYTVFWPYPTIDTAQGYRDYVYFGPVVLPIALTVIGGAPVVDLAATLGVCSDICVPAAVNFSLPLNFAKADAGQEIRIHQAVLLAPIAWDGPDPAFRAVTGVATGIYLTLGDPSVDPDSLIADTGDPATLFGAPQKSPDGRSVFLPLQGGSTGLEQQEIRITFMTATGPYETTLPVGPVSTESAD